MKFNNFLPLTKLKNKKELIGDKVRTKNVGMRILKCERG